MTNQYWKHTNGDVYAVQLSRGEVVGVCGPLDRAEVTLGNLTRDNFNYTSEDAAWVDEHYKEFSYQMPYDVEARYE